MKQTAVEWLYNKFSTCTSDELVGNINNWFEQAKEMEKEQIMDFTNDYVLTQCSADFNGNVSAELSAEEYYEKFNITQITAGQTITLPSPTDSASNKKYELTFKSE